MPELGQPLRRDVDQAVEHLAEQRNGSGGRHEHRQIRQRRS